MAERALGYRTQTSAISKAPPEVVFETIADLRNHLVWSGERANDETFKLLSLESSAAIAEVGTTFSSSGANYNGTFHDRSVVTMVSRPETFVIETDAHLDRKRGRRWDAHLEHRYGIRPEARDRRSRTPRRSSG
jgi:hypothetical protein